MFLSRQLLLSQEVYSKISEFYDSPLYFFYFVISPLVRRNIVWNILMENKALQKSPDVDPGRNIRSRESRAISRKVSLSVRIKSFTIIYCLKLEEVQSNQTDNRWLNGRFPQRMVSF